MDTAYIRKQLKRYRKLRRRDQAIANFKEYLSGVFGGGLALRLVKGGAVVAIVVLGISYLLSLIGK